MHARLVSPMLPPSMCFFPFSFWSQAHSVPHASLGLGGRMRRMRGKYAVFMLWHCPGAFARVRIFVLLQKGMLQVLVQMHTDAGCCKRWCYLVRKIPAPRPAFPARLASLMLPCSMCFFPPLLLCPRPTRCRTQAALAAVQQHSLLPSAGQVGGLWGGGGVNECERV